MTSLLINEELKSLIPPLEASERDGLEASILEEGVRDALIVWNGYIVDGHNRYDICTKHGITDFRVIHKDFDDIEAVKIWIKKNQISRRNLAPYLRGEYHMDVEAWNERRAQARSQQGPHAEYFRNCENMGTNTTKDLADAIGVHTNTASRIIQIRERAPEEVKAKARTGEMSVNEAYIATRRSEAEQKTIDQKKRLQTIAPPKGTYRTIVIDPPWPTEKIEREVAPSQVGFDYPTMTLAEIQAIQLPAADEGAHVYLWTTQHFLHDAMHIMEQWGYPVIFTMVWHKNGGFQPFNLPQYNCEFVLFGRKGGLRFLDTTSFNLCFTGERREHSRKPKEFYELVSRVSPGPRLDYFSREDHAGFEAWGNEAGKFTGASAV